MAVRHLKLSKIYPEGGSLTTVRIKKNLDVSSTPLFLLHPLLCDILQRTAMLNSFSTYHVLREGSQPVDHLASLNANLDFTSLAQLPQHIKSLVIADTTGTQFIRR